MVRAGLCRHAGRQDGISVGVHASVAKHGPHERCTNHHVAVGLGHFLDRGRVCGGAFADGALGYRACNRIYLARGAVLGPEIWRVLDGRLGDRGRSHGRALRRLHHHRSGRVHRGDGRDFCRSALDDWDRWRVCLILCRRDRDVVDLFPQRRGSRLRADFKIQRAGSAGETRLHLSAHADRGRHYHLGSRG